MGPDLWLLKRIHLNTWRHADVEVAQDVLAILILGGLAQKGQKSSGFFATVSYLCIDEKKKDGGT